MNTMKENSVIEPRAILSFDRHEPVLSDQQVAGLLEPKHLNSRNFGGDNYGVHAVSSDRVNLLKPRDGLAAHAYIAGVCAYLLHRSTRFDASDDVPSRQMLILDRDCRLTVDSTLTQPLKRRGAQS